MHGLVKVSKGIPLRDKKGREFFKRIRIGSITFTTSVYGEGKITYVNGRFTLHRRPRIVGLSLLPSERFRLEREAKTKWISEGTLTPLQTARILYGLYGADKTKRILVQLMYGE